MAYLETQPFSTSNFLTAILSLAALFLAIGLLMKRSSRFPESAVIWSFWGWAGFLAALFPLTFMEISEVRLSFSDLPWIYESKILFFYSIGFPILALAGWSLILYRWPPWDPARSTSRPYQMEDWLVPITLLSVYFYAVSRFDSEHWWNGATFNLLYLALTAAWMRRGCLEGNLRLVTLGSALLVLLAFSRYFDLFESLLARGLVFIAVGGVLIGEGIIYSRMRHKPKGILP